MDLKFIIVLMALATLFISTLSQGNDTTYSNNKADYWYKRGLDASGKGDYKDAIASYDKAIKINPDNAAYWDGKAALLASLSTKLKNPAYLNDSVNAYNKAIELYNESLNKNPTDFNLYYYKGLALSSKAFVLQSKIFNITQNKENATACLEEAIRSYNHAVEINPKYLTAWKNIGIDLYFLGRYNESLEAYDKAIEIDQNYGLAWYNKGLALHKLGKYNESIQAYDKALRIFPENAAIWFSKGNSLLSQGDYNGAIDCFEQAIRLNQSYAQAWYKKGIAYQELGYYTVSNASFSRASYLGYTARPTSSF